MDKQNYSNTDNKINLTWTGNDKMSDLEKLDIYILENPDSEENGGTPIASLTGADIAKGKAAITIPDTMESGKYYVRLVYSQEEVTTGIVDTANAFPIRTAASRRRSQRSMRKMQAICRSVLPLIR